MILNQEQKNLLIGVLEHTIKDLDMYDSMEFGQDLSYLLEQSKTIKINEDYQN